MWTHFVDNILQWPCALFCTQMVSSIAMSQFNISHLFAHRVCSIWARDMTLSGATTAGQSGSGSNSNEGVFYTPPQISKAEAQPSDGFMSYPEYLLGEGLTLLQRWILQPQLTGLSLSLSFSLCLSIYIYVTVPLA